MSVIILENDAGDRTEVSTERMQRLARLLASGYRIVQAGAADRSTLATTDADDGSVPDQPPRRGRKRSG